VILREEPAQSKGSILVVRGGAIGDFILTLPVFRALREAFKNTRIEALAYPKIAKLGVMAGALDDAQPIEARALASFFARNGDLDPSMKLYFSRFSIIVSYLYDPDEIFANNIARCSEAQFIQGPFRPDEADGKHATEALLEPLERLAIFDADPNPVIPIPAREIPPNRDSSFWLVAHPGSGSETKNWPEQRWSHLLGALAARTNWRFLLVGGEAEGDRLDRLIKELPADRARTLRNRPLDELAREMKVGSFFVGHDSGISHLAAAIGLPGLILWGHTSAETWAPRSSNMARIGAPQPLSELLVRETLGEILRLAGVSAENPREPNGP